MSNYSDPYTRDNYNYEAEVVDQSPEYSRYERERERDFREGNGLYRSSRYRSRSGSVSRSRSRSQSRSRSRSPHRNRRHHRHRRSRDRSYSRERKSRRDDSGDRYSRDRDRYYDDKRDERRRRSYDDDRSSRGSYDSANSGREDKYGNRVKDEWLAHVWGDGGRPENASSQSDADFGAEHYDRSSYKQQVPNKTLILRGLGPYVTEKDIKEEIIQAGGNPRDIRLIRKKDTGSSRGFAFVEFYSTDEARSMVEKHDGEFRLRNHKVIMQYSIQRDFDRETNSDWYCKCCALNFKRREFCYKCGSDRKTGERTDPDESSSQPTHTVMLKGLDMSTTEEMVLKVIQTLSSLPIRSVRIGRDKATNLSKGICYLEMNNITDALYLHNTLLEKKPRINGRNFYVSYCKSTPTSTAVLSAAASNAGNAAIAAAQWSHQKNDGGARYTLYDVPRLADYSASVYANSPAEKEAFVKHYTEYYTKVINEGGTIPGLDGIGSNPSSTGFQETAVADKKAQIKLATTGTLPSGNGEQIYPVPDVSTYQYDKTSGYYYDPYTTLYYDANSQYYFNSKTNKFLYWDGTRKTYLLAPDTTASTTSTKTISESSEMKTEEERKNRSDDKDKVKVAKRIAKDMEKWAKTLNHKKEIAKQNYVASQVAPVLKAQGAADIGYAVGVLGKNNSNSPLLMNQYVGDTGSSHQSSDSLVAEYGQGSDSEEENDDLRQDDKHVDWTKMACLLCKRAFPNKQTLLKHQQLSDLHKQNLEAFYRSTGISREDAMHKSVQYRDRAKERRVKYNEPDEPPSNRLKENYMKAMEASVNYEQPTKTKIGGDNVGNRLLQKMGWQEGMGLGKTNQGRTDIIQAEARPMSAGLGIRTQGVTPGPGETYKDCVKKMMRARYEEVDNR